MTDMLTWFEKNADKYKKMLDDDDILPCFEETCQNYDLCDQIGDKAYEIVQADKIDMITMISIVGQYLYEECNARPEDIEAICTLLNYRFLAECERTITRATERTTRKIITGIFGSDDQ